MSGARFGKTHEMIRAIAEEAVMQSLIYGDVVIKIQRAPNHDGYFISRDDVLALKRAQEREAKLATYHPGGSVEAALDAIEERSLHRDSGHRVLSNEDYQGFRLMVKLSYKEAMEAKAERDKARQDIDKLWSENGRLQERIENMKGINAAMRSNTPDELAEAFCSMDTDHQAAFFLSCSKIISKWPALGMMAQFQEVGELIKDSLWARRMIESIDDGFGDEPLTTTMNGDDFQKHLRAHQELQDARPFDLSYPACVEKYNDGFKTPVALQEGNKLQREYPSISLTEEMVKASKAAEGDFINAFAEAKDSPMGKLIPKDITFRSPEPADDTTQAFWNGIPKINDFVGDAFKYTGPLQLGPMARTPAEKMETVMDLMRENLISGEDAKKLLSIESAKALEKKLNEFEKKESLLSAEAKKAAEKLAELQKTVMSNVRLVAEPKFTIPGDINMAKLTDDGKGYECRIVSYQNMRPGQNFIIKNLLDGIDDKQPKKAAAPVACGSGGDGGPKACDCGGAKAKTTHSDWCSTRC